MEANRDRPLLTPAQVAALLGVNPATIGIWRRQGIGPKYIRAGRGPQAKVFYAHADIVEWLEQRRFRSPEDERRVNERGRR